MGFTCAKNIAKKGGHVIIASRDKERCERASAMIRVRPCTSAPAEDNILKPILQIIVMQNFVAPILRQSLQARVMVQLVQQHPFLHKQISELQETGARGKVEGMQLDLTSFRYS